MSLVTSASLWTNEDTNSKKRIPSMRRTMRKAPSLNDVSPSASIETEKDEHRPSSFEEDQKAQDARTERVSQLINNMSQLTEQNDGNNLVDFTPISPPMVQKRIDSENKDSGRSSEDEIPLPVNQLYSLPKRLHPGESNYAPSRNDLGVSNNPSQTNPYSSYRRIYEQPRIQPAYYAAAESSAPTAQIDNRLLEKINYMIHLLEQQQNEKTSNLTEEFILYTFLGVFIIFVVDSFARSGKYIR
jgi:hypothetical protein